MIVAALSITSACTARGSSSDASSELAEAADPAPPARPAPTPAPAPVPVPPPEPELLPEGTPPVPGFVIYTEEQTIIVPIDGSPRVIGEGLWLQDDRVSPPALSHSLIMSEHRAAALKLPRCPCLALAGACEDDSLESRSFAARTGELLGQPEQCTCMRRRELAGYPPTELDGELHEACMGGADEALASMVGGQLHYLGWDWNGACHGGLSLYDAMASRRSLIADPPELSSEGMRSIGCEDIGPVFVARPWPIDFGSLTTECDDYYESQALMLRRGQLWAVRDDMSGVHGTRFYLQRPARPDSCPSVNDPCGDPQPFHEPAKLDRKRREFWIATDGSAALTAEGHAYALWPATTNVAIEFELPNAHASTEVIGVRVHADIGPLREVLEKSGSGSGRERAPTTMQPEACVELVGAAAAGSKAKELGNTCLMYIGIEQWRDAEQACLRGLSVADEPSTRGAILYNLGLIAEAEGAREQAGLYYRESLAVRPRNRAVERRLAKLRLP